MTVSALAFDLARALERPLTLIPAPWPIMLAGAAMLERLAAWSPGRPEPLLTPYGVATLAFSQTFNLDGALRGLGYSPTYDANAMALDMARLWREQGR